MPYISWNEANFTWRDNSYTWGEVFLVEEVATVTGSFGRVEASSFWDDGTELNVPDYVFESEYKLKSINEVETYISQSKQLPGIQV